MSLEFPQTPIPFLESKAEQPIIYSLYAKELFKALLLAATVSTPQSYAKELPTGNQEKNSVEIPIEVTEGSKERFGISIQDACKKAGCEAIFEKPSENGEYIIHVGQLHVRPVAEFMTSPIDATEILESQSVIYNLISQLNKPFVVDEAGGPNEAILFKSNVSSETIPAYHRELTNSIATNSPEAACNWHFGERELVNYLINTNNLDLPYLSETYTSSLQNKWYLNMFQSMSPWQIKKMLEEAKPLLTPFEIEKNLEAISEIRKMGPAYHNYSLPFHTMSDKALFAIGAVNKLYFDGKEMTIVSGYNERLQSDALEVMYSDQAQFSIAQNKRDDFAVTKATQTNERFPLIVFGSAHSFINNQTKYGVIRVRTNFNKHMVSLEAIEDFDSQTPPIK